MLDVGDGHLIHWEDWGNPEASPIFHFHGGPGGGIDERHKQLYDPAVHRVIFHSQRGGGKSTPFASTQNNTTQDLIADIEKLREHFRVDSMHVVGGSWGSFLSLAYAIAHPDRVKSLTLWAIFLATQFESDFVHEGYPQRTFPEAWERFIALVPQEHRKNGDSVLQYYASMFDNADEATAAHYSKEWLLWECSLIFLNYDPANLEKEILSDYNPIPIAKLEAHYFLNKCFVPEGYVLDHIQKISHIPCSIVQGRYDMCTPPVTAQKLAKAYGSNATLHMVNGGHMDSEEPMHSAIKQVIKSL